MPTPRLNRDLLSYIFRYVNDISTQKSAYLSYTELKDVVAEKRFIKVKRVDHIKEQLDKLVDTWMLLKHITDMKYFGMIIEFIGERNLTLDFGQFAKNQFHVGVWKTGERPRYITNNKKEPTGEMFSISADMVKKIVWEKFKTQYTYQRKDNNTFQLKKLNDIQVTFVLEFDNKGGKYARYDDDKMIGDELTLLNLNVNIKDFEHTYINNQKDVVDAKKSEEVEGYMKYVSQSIAVCLSCLKKIFKIHSV